MNIYALIMLISYFSLSLLIMSPTITGIIGSIALLTSGTAYIIFKKPKIKNYLKLNFSLIAASLSSVLLGLYFYWKWIPSSKIEALTSKLHLSSHIILLIASIILSIGAVLFLHIAFQKITYIFKNIPEKRLFVKNLICCLIAATATVIISQIMIGVLALSMGLLKFIFGVLTVLVVILFFYCLFGGIKIPIVLGTSLFMIISTVNVYVYNFRGRLFEPVDIFSFKTAMNVADNYNLLPVPLKIVIGWGVIIAIISWIFFVCSKEKCTINFKKRIILALCVIIGATAVFSYTSTLTMRHWQKLAATSNGYILDFVAKFREAYVTEPDGYSKQYIEDLSDEYVLSSKPSAPDKKMPHIIVIMDEAFSDLGVLGDISTDKKVTPFISSLKDETVSGYALTSVYGGNTANSEYEFLTGNSMAWLTSNAVPYQQYVRESAYSMVSYLKKQYSYNCIAMHPYLSDGWNRPNAYKYFGFDECIFIEDFPQKDYVREYISDKEMFGTIADIYEKNHENPLFIFGISMQNHGDYYYEGDNYTPSISLVGYNNEYPDVEQYLSLIYETDKAVEDLISYFSNADDEVIILFFGDHQPKVNELFYEEIRKGNTDSLSEQQKIYMVPFFVWSNCGIEEKYVPQTSLNYLSSYVYEAAGIPLPPYNQFLSELEKDIPSINANGYYSAESQCYLPFDMASGNEELLLESYEILQYNNIFDKKYKNEKFFPILKK